MRDDRGPALSLRTETFRAFVEEHVAPPPARVLEIGCGSGDLARALAADGFEIVAVDPRAPDGPWFRQIRLEDFAEPGPFDAIVASLSLHHVEDLDAAVDKIAGVLDADGVLVLQEWDKELLAGDTARWYHAQRRARSRQDEHPVADDFDTWLAESREKLGDVHPLGDVRRALARLFDERVFARVPYLYSYLLDDSLQPVERSLIEAGELAAVGALYVGAPRAGETYTSSQTPDDLA